MHVDAQDPVEAPSSPTVDPTDTTPRRTTRRRAWRAAAVLGGLLAYATAAQLSTDQIVVKPGDTLTKIAGDYRTTVSAIAAANGIEDPNLIVAGRTLLIPSSTGETTHVVRMGDTVSRLAQIYGTTPDAIVQRNKLADANMIRIGQTLVIPRTAAAVAPPATAAPTTSAATAPAAAPATTVAPTTVPPTTAAPAATTTTLAVASTPLADSASTTTAPPATTTPPGTIPRLGTSGGLVSTMWVVQPGDTVASIAARFGLTPRRLASANAIAETDPLLPGQRIYVPQS